MVSLQEIAHEAGLSLGTVSQVLNKADARYSTATRQLVEAIARKHGYRPNRLAQSILRGKTQSLGVAVHSFTSPVVMGFVEAVARLTRDQGYQIFLVESADTTLRHEREAIEDLLARRVDGLIVLTEAHSDTSYYQALHRQKIPLVLVGVHPDTKNLPWVSVDPELGTYLAAHHLLELGHRRIAFAPCRHLASTPHGRLAGYRRALAEHGVAYDPAQVLIDPPTSAGAVREFTRACLTSASKPTAFLYNDDEMAMVGIQTIRDLGFDIPRDISVVGYNDSSFAEHASPALTSVRQPLSELARAAISLLMSEVAGTTPAGKRKIRLKPDLVIRRSTAPVAQAR